MSSKSVVITNFRTIPGIVSETGRFFMFPTLTYVDRHGSSRTWSINVGMLEKGTNGKYKRIDIEDYFFDNTELDINYIAVIRVDSGVVGGKVRDSDDTYVKEGKNIGKRNETNVFCQALRDALSKYNKQKDKVMPSDLVHPMLAQKVGVLKNLKYPVFVQRKYNGNRAMAHLGNTADTIDMYSRNLKPSNVHDGIKADLLLLLNAAEQEPHIARASDLFFDGELYEHGKSLQKLGSIRAKNGAEVVTTKYYTYDVFDKSRPDLSYSERLDLLIELYDRVKNSADYEVDYVPVKSRSDEDTADSINDSADSTNTADNYAGTDENIDDLELGSDEDHPNYSPNAPIIDDDVYLNHCVLADSYEAPNSATVRALYKQFISERYEGAMIKLADEPYEQSLNGYKSKFILKLKPTYEGEYEVIGFTDGIGKAKNLIMIKCITANKLEFTVTPALTDEERTELFLKYNRDKKLFNNELKGKKIKIVYDELSDDKKPLRARTKLVVREDK